MNQRKLLRGDRYGPCTFDAELAARDGSTILLGGGDILFDLLVSLASKYEFGGLSAAIGWPSEEAPFRGALFNFTGSYPGGAVSMFQTIALDESGGRHPNIEDEFLCLSPDEMMQTREAAELASRLPIDDLMIGAKDAAEDSFFDMGDERGGGPLAPARLMSVAAVVTKRK